MTKTNRKNSRGFIALMSSIIISAVLILIATNMSLSGFYTRFDILDSDSKEQSEALADACIDVALLSFAQNSSYSGGVNATVGQNTCYIGPVTTSGSQKIFKIQSIISNSYTNLKVTVDGTTFAVISVEETPTY